MNGGRSDSMRAFLAGEAPGRTFVRLDPSSYAATFAGRPGGTPTAEEEIAFHTAFPNDAVVNVFPDPGSVVPELAWTRDEPRREVCSPVPWVLPKSR